MICHIVLIQFRPDVSEARVSEIFADLQAIKSEVPGVLAITAGRNESPEKIERGFMHGFVADFPTGLHSMPIRNTLTIAAPETH